jgi:hypothetical protein
VSKINAIFNLLKLICFLILSLEYIASLSDAKENYSQGWISCLLGFKDSDQLLGDILLKFSGH